MNQMNRNVAYRTLAIVVGFVYGAASNAIFYLNTPQPEAHSSLLSAVGMVLILGGLALARNREENWAKVLASLMLGLGIGVSLVTIVVAIATFPVHQFSMF